MSYLRRVPAKDAIIPVKRVTPDAWLTPDAAGVVPADPGYFEILAFTRPEYLRDARAVATKTVTAADKTVTEEVENPVFLKEIFNVCLKGWGNILDPDTDLPIPFTPENVAALPDDAQAFIWNEILQAGWGIRSTRDVITKELGTGAPLDYKSPDGEVPAGEAPTGGDAAQ